MNGFRIGKLFGISIRVDWSWLFIFVLLSSNLVGLFSRWHPDWSQAEALVVALAAALLFFGCVLLHELAHSVVAMAYGLRVKSITLFLFGGDSNNERDLPSATAELVTAIIGPITSIALGILFLMLGSFVMPAPLTATDAMGAFAQLGPIATLLAWLGPINIVIGVFNLIPGFPLDGGRVLRAVLWSITRDRSTATRWAAAGGQAMGWLFIFGGVAMTFGANLAFFGTGFANGLWLAFIGWFLYSAATQATTRLALDEALAGMTVAQLMRSQGPVAAPDLSVEELVRDQIVPDEGAVPVIEDGLFKGLVSISDVRTIPPERWPFTPVRSVTRGADALTATTPDASLSSAFDLLAQQDVDQLPVVVGGRLVGVLRRRDVARWIELVWGPSARGRGIASTATASTNRVTARRYDERPPTPSDPHHAHR